MLKKIYIEITNNCNFNCHFCIKNSRKSQNMTFDNFQKILKKIKGHTKYIYLHVLGEPLMHPEINKFIDYASQDFYVNVTTNGYFLSLIRNNKNIRQINISLHSYDDEKARLKLGEIFAATDKLKKHTFINYRLWTTKSPVVIKALEEKYHWQITGSHKLSDNVFWDMDKNFIWPDLNNNLHNESGACYALKDHIAILVDGSIVPCCLDSKGDITLGNIYEDDLNKVLESPRAKNMQEGFKNKKRKENLCIHCGYMVGK